MKQQTAVDWLAHQVNSDCLNSTFIRPELIEQAKAMEKEQIKEGYIMSLLDGDNKIRRDAEEYYNETYNK